MNAMLANLLKIFNSEHGHMTFFLGNNMTKPMELAKSSSEQYLEHCKTHAYAVTMTTNHQMASSCHSPCALLGITTS
jgi:hypothetical protein